jgi:NADPH-dependent curcumin reductase CurA
VNDQSTVRLVIGVLGLLAFTVVAGGIVLALSDRSIPEALIAMGSAAAGAVGSILARTGGSDPQPVVGLHGGPVAVEDVG